MARAIKKEVDQWGEVVQDNHPEIKTKNLKAAELDHAIGIAWRRWFDLYQRELVEYVTAGSRENTGELTMILRPLKGDNKYCTANTYDEVANLFLLRLKELETELQEKLKPLPIQE